MLKLLTLLTLVEVFDIVNCFIIPHRVAALHYPRWIDTKLDMSGSDETASEVSKTPHHVAIGNAVKGKSWLRCKPIGGMSYHS